LRPFDELLRRRIGAVRARRTAGAGAGDGAQPGGGAVPGAAGARDAAAVERGGFGVYDAEAEAGQW
jgi:hypothetical protein